MRGAHGRSSIVAGCLVGLARGGVPALQRRCRDCAAGQQPLLKMVHHAMCKAAASCRWEAQWEEMQAAARVMAAGMR